MKNYLKLVNFELGRFLKIYLVLAGITVISQIAVTLFISRNYMEELDNAIYVDGLTMEQFTELFGQMSLNAILNSGWFNLPIMLAAAALLFYCFFIWYRDWLGKNTFIYRLLMLPTARLNILLSKATAIFLMVLGLVSLQIILLKIAGMILKWIIPANLRVDLPIIDFMSNSFGGLRLAIMIPSNFIDFITHYGMGFMTVFILFTAILFERSYYRFKGALFGMIYAVISVGIFVSPWMVEAMLQKTYLYPVESFIVHVILWVLVTSMSIWVSNYLLNKKVTV